MTISGYGLAARIGHARNLPVFDCATGQIDSSAAKVIERLAHNGPVPFRAANDARKRYNASRSPLLAPKEDVESVVHIRPPAEAVPPMVFFRPKGAPANARLPALVFLHGGGWTVGSLEIYEPLCRQLANATGRSVIWLDFRLAPEHPFPAALEDTWNAVEWLAASADWIGIDRNQIAIGGDSSGGNLAAATALAARDRVIDFKPQFQLLIYPCLDLTAVQPSHAELAEGYLLTRDLYAWYRQNYVGAFPDPGDWHLSPLFADNLRGLPPTVVLYAGFDPLRDEAIVYSARLVDAGVPVQPLFFPRMIHGFLNFGGVIPAASVAVQRIAVAIKAVLHGQPDADFSSS